MEDKNSDQPQNLVEKIPALDMVLTIPSNGSQPSDQVSANNPCFIMCIDANGRLLRIPMSVLQKQQNLSNNKMVESHDKQKAPVATIAPWISPTHNSQGNMTSTLQHSSLSINQNQHLITQQLVVDQAQQINPQFPLGQQISLNQDQEGQKIKLLGSQQQLVDKLQILMQKNPSGSFQLNVKNLSHGNQQCQKFTVDHSSNLQQIALNSSNLINQPLQQQQTFTQHSNIQTANNLHSVNKQQDINNVHVQKPSLPQATGHHVANQSTNVPASLNLFAVLQNNKLLQSKSSLQLLDHLSSPVHKFITIEQPHSSTSTPVKDETPNWTNPQSLQQNSRRDIPFSSKISDADKNIVLENISGKSMVSLNNIQSKYVTGSRIDVTNRSTQCLSNDSSIHALASQQINILQSPTKASLLLSDAGNVTLKTNLLSQMKTNVQSDIFMKDQLQLTQKADFSNNKDSDLLKSEKQSQLIFLENKGMPCFLQASKYATIPVSISSVNVQSSARPPAPSFLVAPPQIHFSTATPASHQMNHTTTQLMKTGEGLRQVGNVQAIVLPNNISLNGLQLPQIGSLPLSNLSSIHIISSSGLNQDQVLLLSSNSAQRAPSAILQTSPSTSVRQLCNQVITPGKQLQSPVVVVQNSLIKVGVNQECSKQPKNVELQSSPGFKLLNVGSQNSGATISENVQTTPNNQFVVGQEYQLSYPTGLQVVAIWDGKYFKVKNTANASVTPLKTQLLGQDVTDNKHLSSQFEGSSNVSSERAKVKTCKRCGRIILNCDICENCNQSGHLNGATPNKKIKLTIDADPAVPMNSQNLQLNKMTDVKHLKKTNFRKFNSTSPKKDAEIVHILSSDDDEESHSSSWDDSSKTPSSPASLPSSLIPFSGFRVNIKNIYFGKISCDWMNTLTFDRKSVNLLSDSCSVSYCLSACGSEVMLVAAYFDADKHCTYLFLQVNHSSAMKLFDRIFANSRSLYDPNSKDDCAKYIVLFLDDKQTNLMEVIPRVVDSMQFCNGVSHPVYKTIENFDVEAFLKSVKQSGDPILEKDSVIVHRKYQEEDGDETHSLDQSSGPSNGKIVNLFTYPPPPTTGGITVTNEDLFCLNEGEFLNDVIIDFYFKFLSSETLAEKFKNSHIFSSFFYRRLTRKVQKKTDDDSFSNMNLQQRRHAHVRTWTRHVDLFSKDFIVVPINESAHWFLAIICYPGLTCVEYETNEEREKPTEAEKLRTKGKRVKSQQQKNVITKKLPCILVFDSLSGPSRCGVIKLIRDYLQVEWDLKKKHEFGERRFNKDTLKGAAPECPQQTNFSDCGIYILQYVESFFTDPITDYTFPLKKPLNWFDEKKVSNKRAELQRLILSMQRNHNPGLDFNPDQNGCVIKNHDMDASQKQNTSIT